jgi:hypothetical protein
MANLLPQNVPEPNTRGLGSTGGVVDNSVGNAVSFLGNVGAAAYQIGAERSLFKDVNEMVQQEEQALINEQQLTANEVAQIDDLGERLRKFDQMATATGRRAEFEARARALVKEHISRTPGLAQQFRQRAESVIGGSNIGTLMAQQQEQMDEAERYRLAIENDANSLGVLPDELRTPEGREKYKFRRNRRETLAEREAAKALAEDEDVFALRMANLRRDAVADSDETVETINIVMQEELGDVVGNWKTEDILQLRNQFPERFQQIDSIVEEWADQRKNDILSETVGMTESERNTYIEPRFREIDQALRVMTGEASIEAVEAQRRLRIAMVNRENLDDATSITIDVLSDRGVAISDSLQTEFLKGNKDLVNTMLTSDEYRAIPPKSQAQLNAESMQAVMRDVVLQLEELNEERGGEGVDPLSSQSITRIAQTLADGEEIKPEVYNEFIKQLNTNPNSFKPIFDAAPEAIPALQEAMAVHLGNLGQTMVNALRGAQYDNLFSARGTPTVRQYRGYDYMEYKNQMAVDFEWDDKRGVIVNVKDGAIPKVAATEQGVPIYGKSQEQKIRDNVSSINKRYINPVNQALTAMNKMTGIDKRTLLDRVLAGSPVYDFLDLEEVVEENNNNE